MRANFNILPVVVFLASSFTSVSGFSLNDVESIPSNTVIPACESTYNTTIDACSSSSDFVVNDVCSSSCRTALTELAAEIILSCRQAFVSPDCLLRRILDGGILITLCPTESSSSSTESPSSSTESSSPSTESPSSSTESSTLSTEPPSSSAVSASKSSSAVAEVSSTESVKATAVANTTATSSNDIYTQPITFSGFLTVTASALAAASDGAIADTLEALTLDTRPTPTVTGTVDKLLTATSGSSVSASSAATGFTTRSASRSSSTNSASESFVSAFDSSASSTSLPSSGAADVKVTWGVAVLSVVTAISSLL